MPSYLASLFLNFLNKVIDTSLGPLPKMLDFLALLCMHGCMKSFPFNLFQVATFILQKILLDETGLSYICQTYERFSHVAMILVSSSSYKWIKIRDLCLRHQTIIPLHNFSFYFNHKLNYCLDEALVGLDQFNL